MHKQKSVIDEKEHPWSFIEGIKKKKESIQDAICRTIEEEAGIQVENIEYVSELCYHAKLTDDNVNKMQRSENQLLNFFNPKELSHLFLSKSTKEFIFKHRPLISAPSTFA